MIDWSDRLHEAVLEAFRLFAPMLPDGLMHDGDGYHVISAPSLPIPLANAVWADSPDETVAARELPAALAEIEARGVSPAVVVLEGRTPGVEEEAPSSRPGRHCPGVRGAARDVRTDVRARDGVRAGGPLVDE